MAEWFVSSAVLAALLIGAHYLLRGKISARLQYALWLVLLVRQMAAAGKIHAHERIARLQERGIDLQIGLRAGVRLKPVDRL